MMKAISLVIFSLLSVISGVIAQEKTLRVVNASFRAKPKGLQLTDPEVEAAVLDCTIEEDDISFRLSFQSADLQRLLSDIQFIPVDGPANLIALTRRNDQIPLPKAVLNPNPDSRPDTNEMYEIIRAGGRDMDNLTPDEYVLDSPFILDIAYQAGTDYYAGKLEILPEQVDGVAYFFTKTNLNLRFPMRLIPP